MLDTLDMLDMLDMLNTLDMLDILRDASSSVLHDPNIYIFHLYHTLFSIQITDILLGIVCDS